MSDTAGLDARDHERFVFHETPLRHGTLAVARVLFKALMRLDVDGLQHVPATGGFVLASNHVTNWDVFPMQLALPRTIFFMGKAELFRLRPLGALFRDFGAFPVYRGEKDDWAFRHAVKVLKAGQVLGMFPEGHRSRGGGLGPAKTGSARLALEAHCPILPMALTGTDHFLSALPRRRHVRVLFLPLIHAQRGDTPEGLTDRLMYALAAALPEHMRGVYATALASESRG